MLHSPAILAGITIEFAVRNRPLVRRLFVAILASLAATNTCASFGQATVQPAVRADDGRIRSAGIRKLTSKHLVLYTDVPADPEVDRLPAIFDEAVPQWATYFGVDPAKLANWQARAFLIGDRRRFDALGLMPVGNDQFRNGISIGSDLWLHDQPTAYYRRHLLLHEGTHVFMVSFLGGCGPGWYMEGTAELLGTHRIQETSQRAGPSSAPAPLLALNIMPATRQEVPMLGRIKLIRDAVAAGRQLSLPAVMQIDNREQLGNEAYAWCWAASRFLDSHPRYRDRFRGLQKHVRDPAFNEIVHRLYADDWRDLLQEWDAFVTTLEHGYDFERMAIDFRSGKLPASGSPSVTISADIGWQSSGLKLEAGQTYIITATGRYQIASENSNGKMQSWPCEPGGVTIEYYAGRPLGMLIGAVIVDEQSKEQGAESGEQQIATKSTSTDSKPGATKAAAGFANSFEIGLSKIIQPTISGTLYLRVNDSAAKLGDNRGTLTVTIVESSRRPR
jgi:hypothetical protein